MNKRKIQKPMQFRVRKYLEYILTCKGSLGGMMDESELHEILS